MTSPQVMITRVPYSVLRSRIDSGFYAPEHLERERRLRQLGVLRPAIGETASLVTDGTHKTPNYVENGVPFLSATNIYESALRFADHRFVSRAEFLQLRAWNCAPLPNDVVVAKSGSIGNAAVVPSNAPEFAVFESVAIVRCDRFDPYYLATFLNSRIGQQEIKRQTKGAVIRHLHLEDLREVEVPEFSKEAQRYIGDKVRQAERLRERARRLDTLTFAAFDPLTQSLPSPQRAFRVPSSEVEAYRLNPNHFDPVVRAAIHAAKAVARLHPLSDLVVDGDIAGGATPLGAQYVADGIFFARVQNVKPLRLDRSDAAFITAEQDREIVRSRCRTDDVVLSITGYPGTASVVLDEDLPLNINQHSVRFAVRSEFGAGYVAAAINSRFGQLQVGRLAVGGTRDALDYTSVRSLLIPEFSSETREAINAQVRAANLCVRAAQRVVALAKLLVEHLIGGGLNEADLVAAQKALEAGDRSADREILKALRQSDAPNTKPLIADVDALYALLDGSEGQDA